MIGKGVHAGMYKPDEKRRSPKPPEEINVIRHLTFP